MTPATAETDTSISSGLIDRVVMLPTLVHQHLLASCPDGDRRIIRMLGVLMWLSAMWECALFSNAARIMLSADNEWHATHIGLGLLVAAILLLTDAIVFIAASWHAHGLAEVERTHQFKLPSGRSDRLKTASLFGARFLMAVLVAQFMATTTALLAFDKEIHRILERNYQTANAELVSNAAAVQDSELKKTAARQRELAALIPMMEAEERSLRTLNLEPKLDEAQLLLATQRVAIAEANKVATDRQVRNVRLAATRNGEWLGSRAYQQRVALVEREAAIAARALDEARKQVLELTNARAAEAHRKESLAETRLGEVATRKKEIERQIGELKAEYDQRLSRREALTRAAVERDPRHSPRSDGLLARLQALHELSKDDSVAYALYGFDALLMLLELAAIMGKTFTLIPMTYATRVAELDLVRAVETASRLEKAWNGEGTTVTPTRPDVVAEPKPIETAAVQPEPPKPLNGSANPSRRHAPRWRPSLERGNGEPPREH